MRTLIIHNPKSGFGSDAVFQFARALVRGGDECVLRILAGGFIAREACADAEDFDLVVVSGGDGTVAALLYELRGRDVPACVFPSGTANLLCANIGNAPEPSALARACRKGRTAELDLGEISWTDEGGNHVVRGFGLMSGTGFDAQLMQAALPNKAIMGQAAYFAAALANPRPEVEHFSITVDGRTYERDGITCLVANNAMIQGDIQLVPNCRMDDGMLDVIMVETSDAAQLLKPLAFGLVDRSGKAMGRPHLESFSGRKIRVECSHPVPIEVDGEVVSGLVRSYEARVLPRAVRLVVDAMSPYGGTDDAPSRFGDSDVIAYPK
ncbi:diacylglycerol/lipid kinase family protein [Thermophilibacter provencensis]|uniref:Diacylglycerol kinase family protein n=1 Tax=Thermophilibacter provencensis TaxID=1852386 RepID=A0ABT7V549_9ACTN|nr:diacylglycerol kinase family protein [Thermophilibacter provencensis]MDM8271728.1 diacylglycerol kinase family protein [Thermophilibacter provencensis]